MKIWFTYICDQGWRIQFDIPWTSEITLASLACWDLKHHDQQWALETVCNSLLAWESKNKEVFNLVNSSSLWKTWAKSLICGRMFPIYCMLRRGAIKREPWQGSSLIKLWILFFLNLLPWTRWILPPIIFKML